MVSTEDIGLRLRLEELQNRCEELGGRVLELERLVSDIRALGQDFWRHEAAILLAAAAAKSWRYDARDQRAPFSDVSRAQPINDKQAKRWIGKTGELSSVIAIDRSDMLVFRIHVDGFAAPELDESFKLEVDGQRVPWSRRDRKSWVAIVPAKIGHARLPFRVSVDPSLRPDDKDVTFSFCEISVTPLSDATAAEDVGEKE